MGTKQILRLLMVVCLSVGILAKQCSVVPKCTCKIGDETIEVSEQYTGSEALTGAVGAMGSIVLTGGGVSVWYLIKRRKLNSVSSKGIKRSNSDVSALGNRKPFDGQELNNPSRPPNIYTASRRDNFFPNVGMRRSIDI